MTSLFLCTYPLALSHQERQAFYSEVEDSCRQNMQMPDGSPVPFRVVVNDFKSFLATVPKAWRDGPTESDPQGGFPRNLWVGTDVDGGLRSSVRVADLRALRPTPRILFVRTTRVVGILRHLRARRCPVCGTRYEAMSGLFGRSGAKTRCDHVTTCGSVALVPQIHLVVSVGDLEEQTTLQQEGIPLWPQTPLTW